MPNQPTFSIVTCTWNSAATLADTLASVQAQSCRDLEHIFVDAGSSDATLDMIAAYPGNKRVLRDVRGGIGHAMNRGIAEAEGRYVAHLHSDDYYAGPAVLATVGRRIEEVSGKHGNGDDNGDDNGDGNSEGNSEGNGDGNGEGKGDGGPPAWVVGNIQVLKEGRLLPPNPMPPFSYRAYAAGRAWVPHPAVFVRRDVFALVGGFDERLRYAMDVDLWLRLGALSNPALVDAVLAVFRDHAGSVSSRNRIAARREEFAVRRRHAGKAPLSFGIYCLRYLKRMRALRAQSGQAQAWRT